MITRRKAALLEALPLADRTNKVSAVPAKTDLKSEGLETSEDRGLARKMQVITLSSDESSDDDHEEESESDYSDENEASAMSQSSEISATEESDGYDGGAVEDDEDAVVQSSKIPVGSVDSLVAEKVLQIIKGGDKKTLTLDNCRSYLRHHSMRISGNKPVLIDRIKQHIELKQGVPDKYGAATFTINCTGDVCKGDVIKFKQKVYKKFSVVKKGANAVGQRTVVGRVVKESYGEKKQQHTFTVEVLWSSGYKPLPSMHQLLVKGRNLYRLRTYRQIWEDERLRRIILDEKHERGDAARSKRRETRRTTGPRKTTVSSRKQLPNPYVAMGADPNSQRGLPRGSGSEGHPHQMWFPRFPPVTGQENPAVLQQAGFDSSRQDVQHHSTVMAVVTRGVANDKDRQPAAQRANGASDLNAAAGTSRDRNKQDVSSRKVSAGGLLMERRFQSSGLENEVNLRADAVKGFSRSQRVPQSKRDTVPGEQRQIFGSGPAQYSRQMQTKSPCRSDTNRRANRDNILAAGMRHDLWADHNISSIPTISGSQDTRGSPLRLRSRIVSRADMYTHTRQCEVGSQWPNLRSDAHMVSSQSLLSLPGQSSIVGSQGTCVSSLTPQSRTVSWTDTCMDRRGSQNNSTYRKHGSFYRDSPAGVPSYQALSPEMTNGKVFREDSHSVGRDIGNWSPWRHGPDGRRKDRDHQTGHSGAPLRQPWDQEAETRHNFPGYSRQNESRRTKLHAPTSFAQGAAHNLNSDGAARTQTTHGHIATQNVVSEIFEDNSALPSAHPTPLRRSESRSLFGEEREDSNS
ncbi:hypothetical protein R1flu_000741 [Riccia fluitans]|uniref:SAP domain-containing protein n=1 Tax=Riccia fluitans TaxID=41844 RepID=A0ABD1Y1N5_9MARC